MVVLKQLFTLLTFPKTNLKKIENSFANLRTILAVYGKGEMVEKQNAMGYKEKYISHDYHAGISL